MTPFLAVERQAALRSREKSFSRTATLDGTVDVVWAAVAGGGGEAGGGSRAGLIGLKAGGLGLGLVSHEALTATGEYAMAIAAISEQGKAGGSSRVWNKKQGREKKYLAIRKKIQL